MKTKNDTPLASMCPISDWCVGLYLVCHISFLCVCVNSCLSWLKDIRLYICSSYYYFLRLRTTGIKKVNEVLNSSTWNVKAPRLACFENADWRHSTCSRFAASVEKIYLIK